MKRISLSICAGVAVLLSGCAKLSFKSDNELELNAYELYLFYDQEFQFEITKGGEPASIADYKGISSDTLIGYLDEDRAGRFVAKRIGTTTVTYGSGKQQASSEVFIKPYQMLFEEPYLGFGASMDTVKANEFRSADNELADYIWYVGENNDLKYVDYAFNESGMDAVFLHVNDGNSMKNNLLVFYKERYAYIGEYTNGWWFEDQEKQLYVVVDYSDDASGGFLVTYFQNSDDEARATMSAIRQAVPSPASGNRPLPRRPQP